jgi:SAM-dependent methyltransferase
MKPKVHWERVYSTTASNALSWYQEHAERSLRWILDSGLPQRASIIDVGGGASTLVDDLLHEGYTALTVLDLSATALAAARARLGEQAQAVTWIEADITEVDLPPHSFDLWHDRAVFHFLTNEQERAAYVRVLLRALKPGGYLIVATFAVDGPTQCSGLPVTHYTPDTLHAEIGGAFTLLKHEREEHDTPSGTVQRFVYCYFRRTDS